jgi:hypothetical protein
MEAFLSLNAPHWSGYGQAIASCALEISGREMSREDLRNLDECVHGPYRGTFGSMHDLSFIGTLDDEFKVHQQRLRASFGSVDDAFHEYTPDEGRIRSLLVAIEESLLTNNDKHAATIREILSRQVLDIEGLRDVMNALNDEPLFRPLLAKIEHELNKAARAGIQAGS